MLLPGATWGGDADQYSPDHGHVATLEIRCDSAHQRDTGERLADKAITRRIAAKPRRRGHGYNTRELDTGERQGMGCVSCEWSPRLIGTLTLTRIAESQTSLIDWMPITF